MSQNQAISIPKPGLFSFEECLWFLNRNYDECLHQINGNSITKAVTLDGEALVFTMSAEGKNISVKIETPNASSGIQSKLKAFIIDWLDMERNVAPFYRLLKAHPALHYMTKDFAGLRLIGIADLHEALCWCIIGQQINLGFAYKLKRSLVERFGEFTEVNDTKYWIFPQPGVLANLSIEQLKQLQFSRQKAEYIIHISQQFCEGNISKEKLFALPTTEERRKSLTAIRGVGIWTANYALMKTLKDLNCIPHGDIGLLNALSNHELIKDRKDTKAIEKLFQKFRGWESYLVFYLWRSLAIPSFQSK
jgi:DNA-3-methyladenine glycosylase II